jgi:hypothetical protein
MMVDDGPRWVMIGHDNAQDSIEGLPLESDPGRLGFDSRLPWGVIAQDFSEFWGMCLGDVRDHFGAGSIGV